MGLSWMLGGNGLAQRRETLLRRLAGRVHRDVGLPIEQKNLRETGARLALDLAVELDKTRAQRAGELRAERGFARTAQTDERDPLHALVAGATVVADELRTHGGERLPRQTLQELRGESQLRGIARVLGEQLGER